MRTHTKLKPYECSCGNAFVSRSNLTAHEKNHQHIRSDEGPFVCSKTNCNNSFYETKKNINVFTVTRNSLN